MLKHIIALLILSIITILAVSYAEDALQYVVNAHDWVSDTLKQVFSEGYAGNLSRNLIALLCIPVAVGLVAAAIYWLVKRRWFPYFMHFVWVIWLVQTAALLALHKVVI